ncbi:DUF547 domain-containing protein [Cyanobium sp. CH-040]|uniref:DUF547 domain-containing protein n=1 Tax=Cyanobium sp. CH-040 TaxID=2823708 RepID=UPI0020CF4486|nr:DUF547 domain-containing protein [Cyanobium sp. CH-040]
MLRRHVDGHGRVDYAAWAGRDASLLADWLSRQSDRTDGRQDALAHWINLYNAFTVQAVLRRYPIDSIRPRLLGVPNLLGLLRFFSRREHRLGERPISLGEIEHRILRPLGDPRIHFAIVCASIGCPLLRNEAYRPERLEDQLEDDARRFIRNPTKVRYDAAANVLHCSPIFRWYRADFEAVAPSLAAYILPRLATIPAGAPGESSQPDPALRFLPYDWSLNQQLSQRTSG